MTETPFPGATERRYELRNEIDCGLVTTGLSDFHDFRERGITRHLLQIREELAKIVNNALPGDVRERYCTLTYLRQVFSREVVPVIFDASDDALEPAHEIFVQNYCHGLQPLLRVLDALCLGREDAPRSCCLRISFPAAKDDDASVFRLSTADDASLGPDCPNAHIVVPENATSELPTLEADLPDYSTGRRLFADRRALFDRGVAAATALCSYFQLESTIVAYESLMAAVYELYRYREFGREAITILFRSQDPTSFATGVTAVATVPLQGEQLQSLFNELSHFHEEICNGLGNPDSSRLRVPLKQIQEYADPGLAYSPRRVPKDLLRLVHQRMRDGASSEGSYFLADPDDALSDKTIRHCAAHFLEACIEFCEEQHEGRQLQFGIVLGNPFMFRHWPGARPVPIFEEHEVNDLKTFRNLTLTRLVEQSYLTEEPRQRFLIMPYGAKYENSGAPAFAVDLANFQLATAAWPEGLIWSATERTYAYLTHRYPWAVAAIVGSHSKIRLFCGGQLIAYRDGKSWKTWADPLESLRTRLADESRSNLSPEEQQKAIRRISRLVEVALQVSPIIRPGSDGSFFVWAPHEEVFEGENISLLQLNAVEPPRLDPELKLWLSGSHLLQRDLTLSHEVAKLVLLATREDGAVCFAGDRCKVFRYGSRVEVRSEETRARGTKRATAEAFVKQAGPGAVAIAISSDGPVRIYHNCYPEREIKCFQKVT